MRRRRSQLLCLYFSPSHKIDVGLVACPTTLYWEQWLFGLDIGGIECKPEPRTISHPSSQLGNSLKLQACECRLRRRWMLGKNVGRANQTTKKPRDGTPITAHRAFTLIAHHISARVLTCVRTSAFCYILPAPSGGTFQATNRWRAVMPGGVSIASLLFGYGHDRRWRFLSCRS
jgi:hypothetical protein